MVSTHCHFSQKAAYGRARASSYCIYSLFNVARDSIPVARYAIRVSREGANLHLGGTVCLTALTVNSNPQYLGKWTKLLNIQYWSNLNSQKRQWVETLPF